MDSTLSGQPFHCVICLELVYKPIVQACGHLFCFWCVHQAMNSLSESYCPLCRRPYMYFPRICELLHFFLLKALPLEYGDRAKEVKEDEEKRRIFSPQFKGENPRMGEEAKPDNVAAMVRSPASETSPSVVFNVSIMTGGDFSGSDAQSGESMDSSPRRPSNAFFGPVIVGATTGTGTFSLPEDSSAGPSPLALDVPATDRSRLDAFVVPEAVAANNRILSSAASREEPVLSSSLGSQNPAAGAHTTGIVLLISRPGLTNSADDLPSEAGQPAASGTPGMDGVFITSGQGFRPSDADVIVADSSDSLLSSPLPVGGSPGGVSSAAQSSIILREPLADSPMTDIDSAIIDQDYGNNNSSVSDSNGRGNVVVSRYGANSHILQNLFRTYELVREGLFSVASENPGLCSSNPQPENCRALTGNERGNGEVANVSLSADQPVMASSLTPPSVIETDPGCSSMFLNVEDEPILPRLLAAASLSDFQCSVCNELLHRPVVLNCGHAFCRMCVVLPDNLNPSCPSCQSFHPAGEPQVCLELHHFLGMAFPHESSSRREQQALEEQQRLEKASTSMDDVEPVSPIKEGNREPVFRGIGCDGCGMMPIIGRRFKCNDCPESVGYDLCGNCQKSGVILSGRFNQRHRSDHRMTEEIPRYRNPIPRFLRESMEIRQGPDEDANNVSRPHSATDGFEDAENEPEDGGEQSQDDGDVETYFSVVYHA